MKMKRITRGARMAGRLGLSIGLMLCLVLWCAAEDGSSNPNGPVVPATPPAATPGPDLDDPITIMDGDVKVAELDVVVACPLIDLVLQRNYNSLGAGELLADGGLGRGWAHSYAWRLTTMTVTNTVEYPPWSMHAAVEPRVYEYVILHAKADPNLGLYEGDKQWFRRTGPGVYESRNSVGYRLRDSSDGYAVAVPGGVEYRFDFSGRLQRIVHPAGAEVTLSYTNGLLARVAHSNGKALEFQYDGKRLRRVTTPDTNVWMSYEYASVREYVLPGGGFAAGATLLEVAVRHTAQGEYRTTYAWDAERNLVYRQNPNGDRFDFEYDNGIVWVAGPVPSGGALVRALSAGGVGTAPGVNPGFTHATPLKQTGRGCGVKVNGHYYQQRLSFAATNHTVVTTRRGALDLVSDYWFDPGLKRVTRIVGPGGRVETRSYDEGLNLSAVTVSNATAGEAVTIRLRHGPNNVVTNAAIGYRSAPVEGWTFGWDPAWLVLNRVADPEGRVVSIDYTNALPSAVRWSSTPGVEDAARFQYAENGWLVSVTNANGHATRFLHDAQGYVTNIVPEVGPAVTLGYDELGHVSRLGLPGESGERTVEMTADAGGRPVWLRLPNGQEARRRYDAFGSLLSSVDAAGRTNGYGYVLGKLTNVVQNGVRVVSLAYDQQLNTVNIRDALGRPVEAYTLDAQDRPVEVTDVDGRTMRVTWGVEDFVRSIQRFDGTTVSNTYDGAGRVTAVTYPGSSAAFDWCRNGLLKQAANEAGVISNAFDGANRLVRTEGVGPAGGVGYGVDPAGNVTSAVSVAGTQAYTFDAAERVTTINGVGGTFAYGYGPWNGLVAAVSNLDSGLNVAYAFDVMDRATNIAWRTAGGNLVRGFEYAYDATGLITQKVTLVGSETVVEKYTYDGLDRLVGETRLGSATSTVSYAFDLVGNRTSVVRDGVTESYTLGTGNRLATFGAGGAVGCDTAGCVTALVFDASRRLDLAWNGRYQMTEARTNGAVAERYGYDALGRRAWTADGNVTNWHVYDGPHVVADLDATGGVSRAYSYGPGIDNIHSMTVHANDGGTTSVSSVFYYVKDHLGTVHALVDETGSVVERYEYDAWGRVLGVFDGAGNPLAATAVGNRHLWQGREYSWATRLYFFRARWYEPVTGRWLSNDPIGISGGLNQYVFCANDPVNYIDPSGLWTEKGHNKLGRYGGGKFDYAKLDRNYPATLTNPGGHFKKIGDAVHNAMEAARYGESEEFEYAVHEVQDYYSHRGAGITTPGEHVRHGTSPDNPNSEKKRDRYKEADKITRMLEDIWDDYNPPNDSDSPPK